MSRFYFVLAIMAVVFFLVELYAFQALKTVTKNKALKYIWIGVAILAYAQFIFMFLNSSRATGQTRYSQYSFGIVLLFLIPKAILLLTMFGEDIVRFFVKISRITSDAEIKTIPGRRKFVSQIALGIAALPFASFLYGMIKGKYNYKVLKYELAFDDLPEAFDGFTLTQITDIHSGSFNDKEKVQYAVDLVKEQQSDMILFTGDIVNNFASEMDDYLEMFAEMEAPYGKYSVLGNHDYGDYVKFKTKKDKKANFAAVKAIHPKIGFDLLLNESRYIEKDGQRLALIGVENWGKGFNQAGDLKKASEAIEKKDFKILMSHDPSHWEYQVKKDDFNYHLTLSGHTHGLQMGIEIPGFLKWSPASYVYKQWAGLYEEYGRYVNVNRGFGFHGFPGRVGIWPEITVIKLKKKSVLT
ncbi:metallophosphoesterase [Pseudofulvibacter geojedonensis]|uniref:Metallophosphoesterase n=1 Tax=Pseudofulvibacter geojedonensis TaxID=1123758 RepID=A0ABW3I5R2_9FLAO